MFNKNNDLLGVKTNSGEEVEFGEVVKIEIEIPKKSEMRIGRFDKIMSDLQKDGFIKSVEKDK